MLVESLREFGIDLIAALIFAPVIIYVSRMSLARYEERWCANKTNHKTKFLIKGEDDDLARYRCICGKHTSVSYPNPTIERADLIKGDLPSKPSWPFRWMILTKWWKLYPEYEKKRRGYASKQYI